MTKRTRPTTAWMVAAALLAGMGLASGATVRITSPDRFVCVCVCVRGCVAQLFVGKQRSTLSPLMRAMLKRMGQ